MLYKEEIVESLIGEYGETHDVTLFALEELYAFTRIDYFEEQRLKICEKYQLCPLCYNKLYLVTDYEVIGEYQGQPAEQAIMKLVCSECGHEKGE